VIVSPVSKGRGGWVGPRVGLDAVKKREREIERERKKKDVYKFFIPLTVMILFT
jgi:hypothetical protein